MLQTIFPRTPIAGRIRPTWRSLRRACAFVAVGAVFLLGQGSDRASAQLANGGSSGAFGNRSVGTGTISGGNRTFSNSGAGLSQQAQVGQVNGNERFVRGARQQGQFVGADNRDTTNLFSALAGQNSQTRPAPRIQQQPNPNQQLNNANRTTGANRQKLIVPLSLGFEVSRVSSTASGDIIAKRLAKLPGLALTSPLEVSLNSDEATLRGTVATERDRELAERLVLLEPGVSRVRNELQVAP